MNNPKLNDLEGRLKNLQDNLATVFAEAGPDMDMTKVKSLGDSTDVVSHIRARNDEMGELRKQIDDLTLAHKVAEDIAASRNDGAKSDARAEYGDGGGKKQAMGIGDAYVASKSWEQKGKTFDLDIDVKATITTAAGFAPQAVRTGRVVDYATRPLELLDFIPTVTIDQAAVVYVEETTFTNSAAETSEGASKPESTLVGTERTSTVRKIATYFTVTDEQLADFPGMRERLNNRAPFMVRQRLEGQILTGDGSAPNLRGVLNVSGIQTQAKGTDPVPDAIYKAMVLVRTTGQAVPDAVVFNPLDWQDVRLLRTADGIYIWGNPSEAGPEMIWGLNVLQVQALTQNTAVVGAWKQYSELDIRSGMQIDTGYANDDFLKNLQRIRAEIRAAFLLYRPAAFCTVTGV